MKKVLLTIAVIGLAMLTTSDVFAANRRCRSRGVAAPAAPVATAQAGGYRAYSYEPGMAASARTYRSSAGRSQPPYLNAASKALGKW